MPSDDVLAALADTSKLHDFDGLPVLRTGIKITRAGDGLSQALKVDPVELHHGDKVIVVLECEVTAVSFAPIDKDEPGGAQARNHTLRAGSAVMLDAEAAAHLDDHLRAQDERIRKAKEEAAGISRLRTPGEAPFGGAEVDATGMPEPEWTDAEIDQEAAEAAEDGATVAEVDELRSKRRRSS